MLVATLDDPTALAAKGAIERASRMGDCVIVGQGVDKSIHGGANDKKEIDPNNRGSIILGRSPITSTAMATRSCRWR